MLDSNNINKNYLKEKILSIPPMDWIKIIISIITFVFAYKINSNIADYTKLQSDVVMLQNSPILTGEVSYIDVYTEDEEYEPYKIPILTFQNIGGEIKNIEIFTTQVLRIDTINNSLKEKKTYFIPTVDLYFLTQVNSITSKDKVAEINLLPLIRYDDEDYNNVDNEEDKEDDDVIGDNEDTTDGGGGDEGGGFRGRFHFEKRPINKIYSEEANEALFLMKNYHVKKYKSNVIYTDGVLVRCKYEDLFNRKYDELYFADRNEPYKKIERFQEKDADEILKIYNKIIERELFFDPTNKANYKYRNTENLKTVLKNKDLAIDTPKSRSGVFGDIKPGSEIINQELYYYDH